MTRTSNPKTKVAIIGSGNIGTDLMIKVMRLSETLEMAAFVGIDPESDGLKRAERLGVPVTAQGLDGLIALPGFAEIAIVFDATSAGAHKRHSEDLAAHGKRVVNGNAYLYASNVNMMTLRRSGDHRLGLDWAAGDLAHVRLRPKGLTVREAGQHHQRIMLGRRTRPPGEADFLRSFQHVAGVEEVLLAPGKIPDPVPAFIGVVIDAGHDDPQVAELMLGPAIDPPASVVAADLVDGVAGNGMDRG